MCQCPGVAMNDHKLGSFYQQKCIFLQSGSRKLEIKVSQGRAPSKISQGESFLPLPASGVPGAPGLWPLPSSLRFHLHVASSPVCLCLKSVFLSYKDTVFGLRAHMDNPGDLLSQEP